MRLKKIINYGLWGTKFSGLATSEMYGLLVTRINFQILGVKGFNFFEISSLLFIFIFTPQIPHQFVFLFKSVQLCYICNFVFMSTHAVTLVLIKLALITLSSNLELMCICKCFTKTSSWNANTCLRQPNRGVWDKLIDRFVAVKLIL